MKPAELVVGQRYIFNTYPDIVWLAIGFYLEDEGWINKQLIALEGDFVTRETHELSDGFDGLIQGCLFAPYDNFPESWEHITLRK